MIVSIHQPNFLPWLGYFYKIAYSDVFVVLDNVAYSKNSYTNRCRIKTPQGPQWLTVPIHYQYQQLIRDVAVNNETDWRTKHLRTLEMNYARAKSAAEVCAGLRDVYQAASRDLLSDLNVRLLRFVLEYLGLKTKIVTASSLDVQGRSTELLISIVKAVGGDAYLSGFGGAKYQEEEAFQHAGISLRYSDFRHPTYPQLWKEFAAGLSIVDLICNCGRESPTILRSGGDAAPPPGEDLAEMMTDEP